MARLVTQTGGERRRSFHRESAEFDRGLGFFDAIYGFALTLLIANLDVPGPEGWASIPALLSGGLGSQLLGFVISFIVIAVFWKANYDLIGRFAGVNGIVIVWNLVTAGLIVFIPFTTQGMSNSETEALPLPNALYAINIALAILSQMAMFEAARRNGLVADEPPRAGLWAQRADSLAKVAVFAASVPVAFLAGGEWAKYTWMTLIVIGPLTGLWSDRVVRAAEAAAAPAASPKGAEPAAPADRPPAPSRIQE